VAAASDAARESFVVHTGLTLFKKGVVVMSFETTVLFNATISFRDKGAAAKFLDSLGIVVEQSVKVFHSQTQRHQVLENELQNVAALLHHFEDSIEAGDNDRDIAQAAAAASASNIRGVLRVLRDGPQGKPHGWGDDQRQSMASEFKVRALPSCVSFKAVVLTPV
jgi:hypothetical protein